MQSSSTPFYDSLQVTAILGLSDVRLGLDMVKGLDTDMVKDSDGVSSVQVLHSEYTAARTLIMNLKFMNHLTCF